MKHEIDLKKYQIHTDLTIDILDQDSSLKGVHKKILSKDDITVTDVYLDRDNSLNKKDGRYITIEFNDITDSRNYYSVKKVLMRNIKKMLHQMGIKKSDLCLIIGLGNKKSTPDCLGPYVCDNIVVTNHIYELGKMDENYMRVCAISPGVKGETGIESKDIVLSLKDTLNPDFIIVIDSLASQSIERVNKTIQMTDTGIHPGSGIGNERKEISKNTLGIPVLAIGVPTVVDASLIVADTINYLYKHYEFNKEYISNPKSKLTFNNINYLNQKIVLKKEDKKELLGLVGTLDDNEIKALISEVLTPIGYNMMVTPKEIDFIIEKLYTLIAASINECLYNY